MTEYVTNLGISGGGSPPPPGLLGICGAGRAGTPGAGRAGAAAGAAAGTARAGAAAGGMRLRPGVGEGGAPLDVAGRSQSSSTGGGMGVAVVRLTTYEQYNQPIICLHLIMYI